MEAWLPTQSKTTSAPSVSRPPTTSEPAWRRTARSSWSGATVMSAPRDSANWRWWPCLAPTSTRHPASGSATCRSAATVARPSVPAPMTATTSRGSTPADRTACTAHAVGSTMTASSSEKDSGTACSWEVCTARSAVDHPPPVSVQKPVWRPGARSPKATLPHRPVCPVAQ